MQFSYPTLWPSSRKLSNPQLCLIKANSSSILQAYTYWLGYKQVLVTIPFPFLWHTFTFNCLRNFLKIYAWQQILDRSNLLMVKPSRSSPSRISASLTISLIHSFFEIVKSAIQTVDSFCFTISLCMTLSQSSQRASLIGSISG